LCGDTINFSFLSLLEKSVEGRGNKEEIIIQEKEKVTSENNKDKTMTNANEESSKRQCLPENIKERRKEGEITFQKTEKAASESKKEPTLEECSSTPCPLRPSKLYRANSIDLTKKRVALSSDRQLTQSKISGRTLLPQGRSHDIIDFRYEQQLMQGIEPSADSGWTGVSQVERAIAECCETITDAKKLGGSSAFIRKRTEILIHSPPTLPDCVRQVSCLSSDTADKSAIPSDPGTEETIYSGYKTFSD